METRICQDYILKVPGSSIHQTYGLMQLRDVLLHLQRNGLHFYRIFRCQQVMPCSHAACFRGE